MELELVQLFAFAIKAAIFPLSAWLPDSYPTAPAPVTAVFAGLLTKVGIYAILRLETLLFPASQISNLRSEERRVGKECRCRRVRDHEHRIVRCADVCRTRGYQSIEI